MSGTPSTTLAAPLSDRRGECKRSHAKKLALANATRVAYSAPVLKAADGTNRTQRRQGGTLRCNQGGAHAYPPGASLNWELNGVNAPGLHNNFFFNGDLSTIRKVKPEIGYQPDGTIDPTKTWFNTEGFVTATADQPPAFQKRVFPFRVDGVRGQSFSMTNMSVARTFSLGGRRTFQFRADVQNLFNRQHYQNPDMNPTSTSFGQVRFVNNTVMRFITFNTILRC